MKLTTLLEEYPVNVNGKYIGKEKETKMEKWAVILTPQDKTHQITIDFRCGEGYRKWKGNQYSYQLNPRLGETPGKMAKMPRVPTIHFMENTEPALVPLQDIMEYLLSDCTAFEGFCEEMGYNPDSRKDEKMYPQMGKNYKLCKFLFGERFQDFINAEVD